MVLYALGIPRTVEKEIPPKLPPKWDVWKEVKVRPYCLSYTETLVTFLPAASAP